MHLQVYGSMVIKWWARSTRWKHRRWRGPVYLALASAPCRSRDHVGCSRNGSRCQSAAAARLGIHELQLKITFLRWIQNNNVINTQSPGLLEIDTPIADCFYTFNI
uniref:Putative secreted protein n=1 Tax=Anopheles aquasalis TaxID=42839 RepID=T1DQS0_ANOAQ